MNTTRAVLQSPGRIILGSFVILILLGTLLLSLPYAHHQRISFLDALFTATSITCVTGLTTVPFEGFTFFGHSVILLLMQIGGLGLITMLLAFTSLFGELGMAAHFFVGKLFDNESWSHIKRILIFILMVTVITELIGTFFIFYGLYPYTRSFFFTLFLSFFHAVSMFCNAGIVITPALYTPLLTHNILIMMTSMLLMFLGGLGFFTLKEIILYYFSSPVTRSMRLSLDTKIITYGTFIIIVSATLLIYILENIPGTNSSSPSYSLFSLFYTVIASRGTGLLAHNFTLYTPPTICLILCLAFIGGAPAGIGSGIKITTLAILLATIRSAISGRFIVEINGRSIITEQVYKAIAIIAISTGWILATTFCLLITDPQNSFFSLWIESISALTTLGVSTGITPSLSLSGKFLLIASMIIGRIGSLTLILGMKEPRIQRSDFSYPEERIMLG